MSQVNEMISWGNKHSFERYVAQRDDHPPLGRRVVVDTAGLGHDLFVLPGGVSAQGIVFSDERIIIGNLVTAIEQFGEAGIAVKSDGTWKIGYHGGWSLFAIGPHAVVWDSKVLKVVHKFRPFCFAYIKGESDDCLVGLVMPALLGVVAGEHRAPRPLTADC